MELLRTQDDPESKVPLIFILLQIFGIEIFNESSICSAL